MNEPRPIALALASMFEGRKLATFMVDGRPMWIAQEIGEAIGYSDGRSLVNLIRGEWDEEFRETHHFVLMEGQRLRALRKLAQDDSGNHTGSSVDANTAGVFAADKQRESKGISAKATKLLLLTEEGVNRVLLLTNKPAGLRLRDFLDTEVMPSLLRTGSYSRPGTPAPPMPALPPPLTVPEKLACVDKGLALMEKLGGADDRLKRIFRDVVANAAAELAGEPKGEAPEVPLGVGEVAQGLGLAVPPTLRGTIGKRVAELYRSRYGRSPTLKARRFVDGAFIEVNVYDAVDHDLIHRALDELLPRKTRPGGVQLPLPSSDTAGRAP